ncbi:MAG: protein kinase [Deltaproteobacteria bacterium]|nr:protein kinase [Deltaproteobacteria bacterium]
MVQAEKKPDSPVAFGKYLLVDLIALGGMAEVYKAKKFGASGFEKEMVVKRILPRYADNPSFVQMLIDEAEIAVRLTHGNIVPVYELGEFEGTFYIAMEYMQGSTLLDILRKAHEKNIDLPPHFCLCVAAEICAGLSYAFRQRGDDGAPLGLVHRDINPRNIVVTPSGEVKILDFGIARASTKKHQTKSGVIKGTPGYMSPEQMQGFSVDHRSDQFCVAILAHELITLSRLFPAWTVQEMRDLYERGPIPPPSTMNAKCPTHIDGVRMRALKPRPEERFDDAGDFEVALREAIIRTGTAVTAGSLAKLLHTLEQGPSAMEAPPTVMVHTPNPVLLPELNQHVKSTPTPPTEPMARPPTQPAGAGAGHPGSIISLAKDPNNDQPVVPLQPLGGMPDGDGEAKDTQVLAKNAGVEWDANIGSDAALIRVGEGYRSGTWANASYAFSWRPHLGRSGLGAFRMEKLRDHRRHPACHRWKENPTRRNDTQESSIGGFGHHRRH